MVGVAKLVIAPGCGPGGRGFESHYSPHKKALAKASAFLFFMILILSPKRELGGF